MTWRLVLGVIVMQRRSLVSITMMVGLFSRPSSMPDWLMEGLAVLMAAGAGGTAHSALAARELVTLPLGPREWHRAAWLLSAGLPLVLLAIARCLGGVWHAVVSDNGSWLFHASAVRVMFEVLYFSLIGAWAAGTPERFEPDYRQDPQTLQTFVAMAVLAAVPFVVSPLLPESVTEIPPAAWALALVALGVGLVSLIRTPDVYRLTTPAPRTLTTPVRVTTVHTPSTWAGTSSRFEGVWALLPGVAGQALAWTVAMVGLMLVVQRNMPAPTIWQPFDASVTDIRFLTALCTPLMMLLGMCPGLGRRLGELRRLPLSSRGTALLLSLAPAATPLVFWAVLLALHLAASATPPDALRLGLLIAFIGAASLVDALGTKSGSSRVKLALGAPLLLAFVYGMDGNRDLVAEVLQHWSLPIAGLACVACSWLLNLHTVTRSAGASRALRFGRTTLPLGAR